MRQLPRIEFAEVAGTAELNLFAIQKGLSQARFIQNIL